MGLSVRAEKSITIFCARWLRAAAHGFLILSASIGGAQAGIKRPMLQPYNIKKFQSYSAKLPVSTTTNQNS